MNAPTTASSPTLRRTTLPIDQPAELLVALQSEVDPAELLSADGVRNGEDGEWFRSVHTHVLSWYLCASSAEEARLLFQCCERLIALNAPITDVSGPGAASQFGGYPWPLDAEREAETVRLADLYLAAGLLELEAPNPGGIPWTRRERADADGDSHIGLKPLAVAIFMEDMPFARYLLARGASQDLGVVYAGEPPMTALAHAAEQGAGAIHALLAEDQLKRALAARRAPVSEPSPRRRRMAV